MQESEVKKDAAFIATRLKETREEFSEERCLSMGYDVRPGKPLFLQLCQNPSVEYDAERKSFRYKPKRKAKNIQDLVAIIKAANNRGIDMEELNDAYTHVEDDLKELATNPQAYGIIAVKDDKRDKKTVFFNDPTIEFRKDVPKLDKEIISQWKHFNTDRGDDFERVVKDSKYVPYHFDWNKSKKGKKDKS